MRKILLTVSLLCLAAPALGQSQISGVVARSQTQALTAADAGTCQVPTAGCDVLLLGGFTSTSVQVAGTYVGTISFETCVAACTTSGSWSSVVMSPPGFFTPVATISNLTGIWAGVSPAVYFRARMSAFTSGSATVTIYATLGGTPSTATAGTTTLNNILPATGTNTINNHAFQQVWNWSLTGDGSAFTIGESSASTGATSANQHTQSLYTFQNSALSTATPISCVANSVPAGCLFVHHTSGVAPPAVGVLPTDPAPIDELANSDSIGAMFRSGSCSGTPLSCDSGVYILNFGIHTGIGTTADCEACEISFPAGQRGRPFEIFTNNNYLAPNVTFNIDGSSTFGGAVILATPLASTQGGTGEAGTFTGIRKANTASPDTAAVAGTDFVGPTTGATVLLGNGAGQTANYAGSGPCAAGSVGNGINAAGVLNCVTVGGSGVLPPFGIGITIDGAGAIVTTGVKGTFYQPSACTITANTLMSTDGSFTAGSVQLDIWISTTFHPTSGNSIVAADPPTLTAATLATDTTLTSWTLAIPAKSYITWSVTSASTVTRITDVLTCQP